MPTAVTAVFALDIFATLDISSAIPEQTMRVASQICSALFIAVLKSSANADMLVNDKTTQGLSLLRS